MWQELLRRLKGGGGGGQASFIGAYGKLPRIGDFVAVRAKAEPAYQFQGWLAKALDWADRRQLPGWPTVFENQPPLAFVYRPRPRTGGVLVGAMWASRDMVGRRHPFAVFTAVPDADARAGAHLLPLAITPFVEQAAALRGAFEAAGSAAEVEASLASLRPVVIDEVAGRAYDTWVRDMTAFDLWGTLYGHRSSDGVEYAVQMIREVLAPFHRSEDAATELAVRLPLGQRPSFEASFWVDAAQRLGGTLRTAPTILFHPHPSTRRGLYVALGDTHASALVEGTIGAGDTDLVMDLTAASRESSTKLPVLGSHIEGEIRRDTATLDQVLEALGPHPQ